VKAGAVPRFIELLHSPDNELCEQAAWGIGNIVGMLILDNGRL